MRDLLTHLRQGKRLIIKLRGEIDHHTAKEIREQMDTLIWRYPVETLVVDVGDVTFMDSSGIGILIGRYRIMKKTGGAIRIRGARDQVDRILEFAGIYQICGKEA